MQNEMTPGLAEWLRDGERGQSSNTMVEVLEGLPPRMLTGGWGWSHPHDPADLMRCVKLLDSVPAYRERLDKMRSVSLTWNMLIERWSILESLLREEVPTGHGRAPKTYAEMQRLIAAAGAKW